MDNLNINQFLSDEVPRIQKLVELESPETVKEECEDFANGIICTLSLHDLVLSLSAQLIVFHCLNRVSRVWKHRESLGVKQIRWINQFDLLHNPAMTSGQYIFDR